ncbi:xylose isomerase-like protein [Penicillium brevicompactum]|uniref:Xylose isomerase-like protein n=1 Tax=Penicillium brevicompactum TaxID=5074 RepID=A0A9W9R475_PENBR|nr:xylose isomerase-like protein [Penicillium brevicompactum]
MHLAAHTWMRSEPLEATLARLQKLGYHSIELAGEPDQYPIEKTRQLLEDYGINCWGTVTVQSGKRNLIAADPQQRRDTIEYMKAVVELSAGLGGKIVTVVPGNVGTISSQSKPEDEWRWAVEGLREVAFFARAREIKVGLELLNRYETFFLNRVNQALALADEVGFDVGVTFDPFHLAIEEPDLVAAIRACGSRIIDFHVADNNRLPPGDGSFDWKAIIEAVRDTGYDGCLTVEFLPPIDRTPVGDFGSKQLEEDDGSTPGLFTDKYYTELLRRSKEVLAPFLETK